VTLPNNDGGEHVTRALPRTAALSSVGAQFQTQSIQPDEIARIALTNSNGNAAIPLSSYGLNVTE